jgi:Ran GTPase-activating protein (RanGAP) involved in mRNA processing and transport
MDKVKFKNVNTLNWSELVIEYNEARSTLFILIRLKKIEDQTPEELLYLKKTYNYFQELSKKRLEKYKEAWQFQAQELFTTEDYFKEMLSTLGDEK